MFFAMLSAIIILLSIVVKDQKTAFGLLKTLNVFGDGVATIAFIYMIAQYSGNKFFSRPAVLAFLAIVPIMTTVFSWSTNLFHYDFSITYYHGWRIIDYSQGMWHQVNQLYLFTVSAIDMYMLVSSLNESRRRLFTSTVMLIFVAITYYLIAFVSFFILSSHVKPINYLIYVWTFAGLIAMVALFRTRKSELIPVAIRTVIESASDIMLILNHRNIVVDFNRAATEELGLNGNEIIGRPVRDLLSGWGEFSHFIEENNTGTIKQHIYCARGKRIYILTIDPLKDEISENIGRLLVLHDVTEIETREEIERSAMQLRALSQRTIAAQEEERNRLGRELHDDFGHKFLTLSLNIETIKRKNLLPDHEINALSNLVREISISMMSLYRGLKPTVIERLGLAAAIESQLREMKSHEGLAVKYKLGRIGKDDIPFDAALGVFRIFQESMTNVIKHSEATEVEVNLEKSEDRLKLIVMDNGRGMVLKSAAQGGIGLIGMRERTALLGGELIINSEPGRGTTVTLTALAAKVLAE